MSNPSCDPAHSCSPHHTPEFVEIFGSSAPVQSPLVDYSTAPALVSVHGLHRHRFAQNPEEQRFADAWMDRGFSHDTNLQYLLRPAQEQSNHNLGPISDRDREVAATVVQWLGSPVGQGFLRDLGYTQRPLPPW